METQTRTLAKSITWQMLGLVSMMIVTWVITGSAVEGGAVAGTGAAIGFVCYVAHERVWARIRWGVRANDQ